MNIIRKSLLGLLLIVPGFGFNLLLAQTTVPADSAVIKLGEGKAYEPGPFFNLPKEKSVATFSTVTGSVLEQTPVANITNTLYGRLQGLTVEQGSGEPGYDNANLSIRGRGTYDNAGLTIFVDGFQTNSAYFSYLSPVEIESISVLKDPAVLATFGMKGANGVLWVKTKRGKIGKPTLQGKVVTGWQSPLVLTKPFGSYDYARLYNQAISNDNFAVNGNQLTWTPRYTQAELDAYRNGTGTNVDWYNETLKKHGHYTDANVVFSGGDPTVRYALILDYMKQGGLYNVPTNATRSNAQIQRYNIRSNIDFNFFKIFEAKVDLGGRIEDRRYPNINGPTLWNNMGNYPSNIYPVKDVSGYWSGTALFPNNPVASINALGWTSTHDRTLQANFNLKERLDFITPGLYLNEAVSFNTWARTSQSKTATYGRYFNGATTTTDRTTDIISNAVTPVNQYDWKQVNITAGYDRIFGKHDFTGAVNYYGSSNIVDNGQHPAAGQNRGVNIFYNFQNIGGRFNYTYNARYILEAAFGWSGSDNFAPDNRWGFYPAVSLGWVISKEDFLQDNATLSLLKLRASAGQSAMDQSNQGRYLYQQYYVGSGTYYTGNSALNSNNGLVPSYAANPQIFAEKSTKYNVGLDVSLFNKLSVTMDVFQDNRSGIVTINRELSALYGATLPFSNIGEVTNQGVELSADFSQSFGAVQFYIGGMAAYTKNKIVYQAETPPANAFNRTTGLAIGTPMGLEAIGFYDITDFNANGTLRAGLPVPQFGAVQPGDIMYKDLDGNNRVDQNDITEIGKPGFPTLNYAFHLGAKFKGLELAVLFQGVSGRSINLLTAAPIQSIAFVNNANVFPVAGNAWAYFPSEGIDTRATANYPRLTTRGGENNYRNSSFWIKNGDFLRLRNIEVGYNIPSSVSGKLRLENLRIFFSAVNPLSWSDFERRYNMDPETVSGYPGLKSYNAGLSITL